MKYYDSMGFESEHGIWMRRVDAAELSLKLDTADTRIRELEACIEGVIKSYSDEHRRIRELETIYSAMLHIAAPLG